MRIQCLTVLFCLASLSVFGSARAADPAKQLIEAKYAKIQVIIATEKNDKKAKAQVVSVLESFTDFETFGQLTIRSSWKTLKPKQRATFLKWFKRLVHRSYARRFKPKKTLTLSFRGPTRLKGNKAMVRTNVKSGRSTAEVDYKLHRAAPTSAYKAYDIIIDEVSLMRNYRKQFTKIMRKSGFDVLVQKMKKCGPGSI